MERFKLPFLFLMLVHVCPISVSQQSPKCLPSSCGQIHHISYPFRLQDPPGCGSRNFELLCKENNTLLQLGPTSYYYVKEILYENRTMTRVDLAFLDGNCNIPSNSRLYNLWDDNTIYFYTSSVSSFMKCNVQIQKLGYWFIPCLSQNGTYVYVNINYLFALVGNIETCCSFLGITPIGGNNNIVVKSSPDIFQQLKDGFVVHWILPQQSFLRNMFRCMDYSARQFFKETRKGKSISSLCHSFLRSEGEYVLCVLGHTDHIINLSWLLLFELLQVIAVLYTIARFVVTPLSVVFFILHKFWSEQISIDSIEKFLQSQERLISPKRYAYPDIIALTGHFKEKLGHGGFGSVFKGKLISGQELAIKMLANSKFNGDAFINEVSTLGRIYHVNVVQLLGFCSDGSKRALVYEYMPNGSLDKYIFSGKGIPHRVFSWQKLKDIALGVAHGIDYLHRGCDMQILHFDIKPHNILLDKNFIPKISDFGLAKLYPRDRSLVSVSAARGTIGYIAPELISRSFGVVSYKSDVYSFGMLLLEMAGGRRNAEPRVENASQVYYPSWIYEKVKEYKGVELSNTYKINALERKLCIVGLWCIQMKSSDRPPMSRVVEMLEGDVEYLPFPPPPFFSTSENNLANEPLRITTLTSLGMSEISEEADYPLLSE